MAMLRCRAVIIGAALCLAAGTVAQSPEQAASELTIQPRPEKQNSSTVDGLSAITQEIAATADEVNTPLAEPAKQGFTAPALLRQQSGDSGWQFAVAPYFFAAALSGTVGARGRTVEVDASFGNVWEKLDIGLMGTFEARKGRFVSFNDFFWTKLSAERDTPGGLFSTAKVGVNLLIIDPEVGYRAFESERGFVDVLGGVRVWSVETNLNFNTGTLPGFDVSERKTWAAPVGGVRGVANLSKKFYLTGKFDIGGAGLGADLTSQLFGGAGYRVTKNVALVGGYRWLQVDYSDDEGFIFDTQMHGLMFGAKFGF